MIIAGVIILIATFSMFIYTIRGMYMKSFGRVDINEFSEKMRYIDLDAKCLRTKVQFYSGKYLLTGYIYGECNHKGVVVISHGLGSCAESNLPQILYFVRQGWRVFSYDNTGTGQSSGKGTMGLPQSVINLDSALTFIENTEELQQLPIMLYGHSWGGYAVAAIFNYNHNIAASVSISGFNSPTEMLKEWVYSKKRPIPYVQFCFARIFQKLLFGKKSRIVAIDGINRTHTPIFIIHGSKDISVRFDGAGIIARRADISNPNVKFKVCSAENQNEHSNLFLTREASLYMDEISKKRKLLSEKYNGEIPREENLKLFATIDKEIANQLDTNFMDEVNAFYNHNIT